MNESFQIPTTENILLSEGHFYWSFGQEFFVETQYGNFVWSDPDYEGTNTFKRTKGTFKDWIKEKGIPYARDKGIHTVIGYCGDKVSIEL